MILKLNNMECGMQYRSHVYANDKKEYTLELYYIPVARTNDGMRCDIFSVLNGKIHQMVTVALKEDNKIDDNHYLACPVEDRFIEWLDKGRAAV